MPGHHGRRRALLAGTSVADQALPTLFALPPLRDHWDLVAADDAAHARVLLRHSLFDAVLLQPECVPDLDGWTAGLSANATVVQLAQRRPEALTRGYRDGVSICLPCDMTLAHPPLLEAALDHAARLADERRIHAVTHEQLEQCRRQIDRLVSLIWRSTPAEPGSGWLPQRYVLERLEEELARSARHATPFTLALGELQPEEDTSEQGRETVPMHEIGHMREASNVKLELDEWAAETVGRAKRRCDVAGQYGPNRFLLLMVHTPKSGGVTCCRRLQRLLQACPPLGGPRESVRAWFGLAHASTKMATAPGLLRLAEQRLDAARGVSEGIATT